jgi:hypothetical protein
VPLSLVRSGGEGPLAGITHRVARIGWQAE